MPAYGLASDRLVSRRIEDLDGAADHVVCINVLSNLDNYHRPLERLLRIARKSVVIRESLHDEARYQYVIDRFLDPGAELRVHVNTYATAEVADFVSSYGFKVSVVKDDRAGDEPELVIGYPHYWKFLIGHRV